MRWTPAEPGIAEVAIRVYDGHGNITGQILYLTIIEENSASVITSTPQGLAVRDRQYQVTAALKMERISFTRS